MFDPIRRGLGLGGCWGGGVGAAYAAAIVIAFGVLGTHAAQAQGMGFCYPGTSANPSNIKPGQSTSFTVCFQCINNGPVTDTLTIDIPNLPKDADFTPQTTTSSTGPVFSTCNKSDGTTITITTKKTTPPGKYTFTVNGVGSVCPSYNKENLKPACTETFTILGPRIYFMNSTNDVTNPHPTTNVALGQQIELWCGSQNAKGSWPTVTWSVTGETVGGYIHGTKGEVISTNLAPNPVTFYWTTLGTKTVTCTPNGEKPITATFEVQGPTSPSVTATLGDVQVFEDAKGIWWLGLGNVDTTKPGITFTNNTAEVPGGNFLWVQKVSKEYTLFCAGGHSKTCQFATALDTVFPYPSTTSSPTDSPDISLTSQTRLRVSFTGNYKMFLMWQSSTSNSIPVPFGAVPWTWSGHAIQDMRTHTWSCPTPNPGGGICATGSSKSTSGFTASSKFPTWTAVSTQETPTCVSE